MKGLFLRSIQQKQKITIYYMDRNNHITQRSIRVLRMHDDYIIAYCYYRRKVRMFKFASILSAGEPENTQGA